MHRAVGAPDMEEGAPIRARSPVHAAGRIRGNGLAFQAEAEAFPGGRAEPIRPEEAAGSSMQVRRDDPVEGAQA